MIGKVVTENGVKKIQKINSIFASPSLDVALPIGFVYTQYPNQASPATLFPDFTWTEINYGGAFFRASGGDAASFITENDTLTPQGQGTAVNGLSLSKSGSAWGNQQTIYSDGRGYQHSHIVYTNDIYTAGGYYGVSLGYYMGNYDVLHYGYADTSGPNHSHILDFYPSVSENISFTVSGGTETRPKNYTVKIWERTA